LSLEAKALFLPPSVTVTAEVADFEPSLTVAVTVTVPEVSGDA